MSAHTNSSQNQTAWGIIGPGRIARRFAQGLAVVEGARIAAVASRSAQRAQEFADEYAVATVYDSYDAIIADSNIDVIYVATPHPQHFAIAQQCIQAGKSVLCEKPLCVNAQEVAGLIASAQAQHVFLMEAMWTRFLPIMATVREWIDEGRIGQVRQLKASFAYNSPLTEDSAQSRTYNPALAGGSLLDVGVYPVSLAQWLFAEMPEKIDASAIIGSTGVDEQCAMILRYASGAMAVIDSGIHVSTDGVACIYGDTGKITIGPPFWCAEKATLDCGGEITEVEIAHKANGFEYEAAEVQRCLSEKLGESKGMTHQDSIDVMDIMDGVREIIGLRYPFEDK